LAEAVAGADLVVLAVPVLAMRELLESLAARSPQLATDALVTDLGSTKAQVVAWAEELLPAPERFVGGHPMAGSEEAGIEAAEQGLLRGCVWCLTPTARTSQATLHRMQELVTTLGAHPVLLAASQHDAAVAAVSHLPLLAASALVITASQSPAWAEGRMLAAGGFRDSTRVASGNPRMARDICLTNAQPLVACLDAYIATLQTMRERLLAGDAAIEETFRDAKQTRDSWIASSG
jgi:prephenate dehydrogenase